MNRLPDERDVEQMVRSWMRDDDEHPADRNRQLGRIMGRIDETHQRRGPWRFLPFGDGGRRIDSQDEELYVAGRGAVAMRRGVTYAMAMAAVLVLFVMGATFITLLPPATAGPGAAPSPSPQATIHPEDAALQASFQGLWSGDPPSLSDVREVYAQDAVHTVLWLDRVERVVGPLDIWQRILASSSVNPAGWIPLLDAGTGEHRYLGVTHNLGGMACVVWVKDALITRHDCILPMASTDPGPPTFYPAADGTTDALRALYADLVPGWGTADRELIERAVSPEIVHHVAYDNAEVTLSGIDEYMTTMGYGEIRELAAPVPLPAPTGEHRWTDFNSVAGGSLCTFWERGGLLVHHDCIVPTFTYVPSAEEDA